MTASDHYLDALRRELDDVDPAIRDELLRGVREELAGLSDADARDRMRVLGEPAFVAASARTESGPLRPRREPDSVGYCVATVLLGSIGGIVVPMLGWLIGLVLLWASASWALRQKVLGTILIALGPIGPYLLLMPAYSVGEVAVDGAAQVNPLLPGPPMPSIILAVLVLLAWLAGWIWLLVVAMRARRR